MASYNERCGCDGGLPSEFYQIERIITDINNHPPTPGTNGYWMIWNPATRKYEESTVPLPDGTLPDISDATKGWYLTNDGERVYWAKVNGGGGDKEFAFTQSVASATWEIQHDMDKYPAVTVVDTGSNVVIGEVVYNDQNKITITFSSAFSGKAYLN